MRESSEASYADKLILSYPAAWWGNMWREALPSGNGVIGASVFGGVQEETVLLNHAALWHWGHKDELPDVSEVLPRTRKLMDEKRYLEASWQLADALKEQGYGTRLASRFPLAALRLEMPCDQAFKSYSRTLRMDTGEVEVSWKDGPKSLRRRLFVSRADGVVVYAIDSPATPDPAPAAASAHAGGRGCRVDRSSRVDGSSGSGDATGVAGRLGLALHPSDRFGDTPEFKALAQSVETGASAGYAWYAAGNDDGTDFGAVLRVIPQGGGGRLDTEEGFVHFGGMERVLVLVKVFVQGERHSEIARLKSELAGLPEELTYEELLASHTALHTPLYRSVSLELEDGGGEDLLELPNERLLLEAYQGEAPAALVRKLWSFGRYLFISGTSGASPAQPFGLYGLWGGDYRLVWSHNMANENIQMMYWHANTGGLGGLAEALFRYYEGLMEDFRNNARKLYGCRGIYIPAGTTPGNGSPNQIVPVILNWTGAASWLARHYDEYYRYTGDLDFLRERAMPFMREALAFYLDFLVTDGNGNYKLYPSVSPENTPLNYMPADGKPLAHPMPTTINATMDVALLKELLSHLIDGSRALGGDPAEIAEWSAMLERLPAYRINGDGAVCEWIHRDFEDRYTHRHLSHLYPVFPGHEVTRENNPALFQAFETAVQKREIGAQTGWSLAHMAAVYARLGDGSRALDCLDLLTRASLLPNLFTLHNDWRGMGVSMNMPTAPVQMDANMGVINAVQEMLLQASPGVLKLLPALPGRWRRGRLADWRFHTGRVTLEWDLDAGSFHAEITADRDTQLVVLLPDWAVSAGIKLDGPEGASAALGQEAQEQGSSGQAKGQGTERQGTAGQDISGQDVCGQGISGYKLRLAQGSPPVVFRTVSGSC
jgi:alpha-L-fucosidase 2